MTEQLSVEQGNKLIAEFMGKVVFQNKETGYCWVTTYPNVTESLEDWAKYHSSWDWLMPVVEKIRNDHYVGINFFGGHTRCEIIFERGAEGIVYNMFLKEKTSIEIVWLAVIEFIKWYNQNKQ